MREVLLYIHGKGGSSKEIELLKPFFSGYEIHGIDFADFTPWGTEKQIPNTVESLKKEGYNSKNAFFISPILDMEVWWQIWSTQYEK